MGSTQNSYTRLTFYLEIVCLILNDNINMFVHFEQFLVWES
jgi:hypothetical protein